MPLVKQDSLVLPAPENRLLVGLDRKAINPPADMLLHDFQVSGWAVYSIKKHRTLEQRDQNRNYTFGRNIGTHFSSALPHSHDPLKIVSPSFERRSGLPFQYRITVVAIHDRIE